MLATTCHCGAVRLEVPEPPPFLVLCNCSICRRNGALWASYAADAMRIEGRENETAYVFRPKTIRTIRRQFRRAMNDGRTDEDHAC